MQQILVIALSAMATVLSGLVLFNLKALAKKVEKHDGDIRTLEQRMAACKIDCDRSNVSKEDWVRSEGFTRRELKEMGTILSRIEGKFCIVEKLPEIIGSTVRESVSRAGGQNNG